MRYTAVVLLMVLIFLISVLQKNTNAETEWTVYELNHKGQLFTIPYNITNGDIGTIEIDPDFVSLFLFIETSPDKDGILEITIPREILDPIEENGEYDFTILVHGEETKHEETGNSPCFRTVTIPIPAGTEEVEIIESPYPSSRLSHGILPPPFVYVATDKDRYEMGGIITILGCTSLALDDREIILEVLNLEGKVYRTIIITPNIDGSFSTSLVIEGKDAIVGTYTAKAVYADKIATSSFEVFEWNIYNMSVEGQAYKIPYKITNGEIKEMYVYPGSASIIIPIEGHPSQDGSLEIVVPRELVNQDTQSSVDEPLYVVVYTHDYLEVDGKQVSSPCSRTLSIPFPAGTKEIEFGSFLRGRPLAEPPPLSVSTDKHNYELGESITVRGRTCSFLDEEVNIQILNPEGEVYKTVSATPNINGQFSASIVVEGEHVINGNYTTRATYAGQSDTITFVVPEFPVSIIIFATAISFIFVTRLIPSLKIGSRKNQLNQT